MLRAVFGHKRALHFDMNVHINYQNCGFVPGDEFRPEVVLQAVRFGFDKLVFALGYILGREEYFEDRRALVRRDGMYEGEVVEEEDGEKVSFDLVPGGLGGAQGGRDVR